MKTKFLHRNLYLLLIGFCIFFVACKSKKEGLARSATHIDSTKIVPDWIAMMANPNVNYYEAVAAFEKYWENKERPTEGDGEAKDIFGKEKTSDEKNKEAARSKDYVYEYKQFLNWQQRNKNLVKPDGTIMTPEEIIEQWKKMNTDSLKR